MTDFLSPEDGMGDEFLRKALLLANSPQVMGLAEDAPACSPTFVRRMEKLLANPFHRAKKEARPLWAKVLSSAAMFLFIAAMAFSAAMLNPTARAWFENIVVQWNPSNINFVFGGTAAGNLGTWTPEYLPEGYEADHPVSDAISFQAVYQNEGCPDIAFDYILIQQGTLRSIDSEHSVRESVLLNGRPAELLRSNTAGKPSYLLWTDADQTTSFCLVSELSPDELLKIAQAVVEIE